MENKEDGNNSKRLKGIDVKWSMWEEEEAETELYVPPTGGEEKLDRFSFPCRISCRT